MAKKATIINATNGQFRTAEQALAASRGGNIVRWRNNIVFENGLVHHKDDLLTLDRARMLTAFQALESAANVGLAPAPFELHVDRRMAFTSAACG